jgi:hypothetical protein
MIKILRRLALALRFAYRYRCRRCGLESDHRETICEPEELMP